METEKGEISLDESPIKSAENNRDEAFDDEKLPPPQTPFAKSSLPVKTRREILPYEKENYSAIEKAVVELSAELANLSELRDAIEHSFENKTACDDKFHSEVTAYFNSLRKQFENFNEKFTKEIDYNRELELKIQNNEYKGQIYLLERELNDERAKIALTLDEINRIVKENAVTVSEKCLELKSADNLIKDAILKFRSDSAAAAENEYKALKANCESTMKGFSENAQKTLETVKKAAIDFITQCEKQNKTLIEKIPAVKGKLTVENYFVIAFGCIGAASLLINLFMR